MGKGLTPIWHKFGAPWSPGGQILQYCYWKTNSKTYCLATSWGFSILYYPYRYMVRIIMSNYINTRLMLFPSGHDPVFGPLSITIINKLFRRQCRFSLEGKLFFFTFHLLCNLCSRINASYYLQCGTNTWWRSFDRRVITRCCINVPEF